MFRDAYHRFRNSMNIGYEQWHDGVGYDLGALDEMSDRDRASLEPALVARAESDWRDLEALDRLGTPGAVAAIIRARQSNDPEIRLHAHTYGPPPSAEEWDSAIPFGLERGEPYAGLTLAIRLSIEHPSPTVVAALWRLVHSPGSTGAYHAAEALLCVAGVIDGQYNDTHRALFLRMNGPETSDRIAAVRELRALCEGTPGEDPVRTNH